MGPGNQRASRSPRKSPHATEPVRVTSSHRCTRRSIRTHWTPCFVRRRHAKPTSVSSSPTEDTRFRSRHLRKSKSNRGVRPPNHRSTETNCCLTALSSITRGTEDKSHTGRLPRIHRQQIEMAGADYEPRPDVLASLCATALLRICLVPCPHRKLAASLPVLRCGKSGPAQIRTAVTATRRPKDTKLPHRPAFRK